jgi:hypothetical protein
MAGPALTWCYVTKLSLRTHGSVIFRSVLENQPQVDHKWLVKDPTGLRDASATRRVE